MMTLKSFDKLIPLAKKLNAESSDLNATIALINHKLASLNFGIEVWCGPWEDEPWQIGYAKVEDGRTATWELATRSCVVVKEMSHSGYEEWNAEPGSLGSPESLLKASRNIRVDGLQLIEAIFDRIAKRAQEKIDVVSKAKQFAKQIDAT
jgi:hypothetical protein